MQDKSDAVASDIAQKLGLRAKRPRWRRLPWAAGAILVAALAGLAYVLFARDETAAIQYQSAEVQRGDLVVTVSATGNLEPTNLVDVGIEVSGTVASVDVDFNDRVRKGQVLARLDTSKLDARVRQSDAALELARASVREAEATALEAHGKLKRALELRAKGLCSQEDCDTAQATADRADAALARARAQVTQTQAQLDADRTELAKAVIRSPIDGIVLKRAVEPGQTVAASLQTPVLFSLAENLAQMELHVHVDEADVGQVKDGQAATFTVDAFPGRSFPARITQVRYGAQQVEGVTTYETVLKVDNTDLSLRPGMTATANIVVSEVKNALLVPNAALRFTPPSTTTSATGGGLVSRLLPRPPHAVRKQNGATGDKTLRRVWVLRDGQPEAVNVKIGGSNGILTQVLSGDLAPGARVIVDTAS